MIFPFLYRDLARAELIARGHNSGKCPCCGQILDTFLDMVKHYSIVHKKVIGLYHHWYKKPNSRPLTQGVAVPGQKKKTLRVKYFGDSLPRMVDTEAVTRKELEEEKNAVRLLEKIW